MNKPFCTLQLNDSYKPVTDGVAVCAENYARWFHRGGVSAVVAVPWSPGYHDRDEFPVIRYASIPIPGRQPYRMGLPGLDPLLYKRLWRWLDHLPANGESTDLPLVIHAHAPFASSGLGNAFRRWVRRRNRRAVLVATLHSKYHEDFARYLPEPVVNGVIRHILRQFREADAVWTPNKGTAETLREYGFDGHITVVPNGADLPRPTHQEYTLLRERGGELIGLPESHRVLLFVGQHRWEKNIRLILESLAVLSQRYGSADSSVPWRMVFVGAGPDEDEIRRLALTLGLVQSDQLTKQRSGGSRGEARNNRVIFYGHVSHRDTLKALYARSDLFVFPSLYDNAPLVVREAAAFHTPSILARGSDAAGDTIDNRNAFHVTPRPDALAALLDTLLTSPETVSRVGYSASQEVFRSWQDVVEEVSDRYQEILQRR